MSDITYTIGAKDQASAPMRKVESSMERLEKSTKNLGETSEKSLNRMSIGVGSLVKASGILFVLDKAIQGIGAAFSFVAGGIGDFDNAEASVAKLTSAMEANGEVSQASIDANLALSDAIEKRLNVEAEAAQGLMASAANLGVANDKLDDMTLAAIGLSEAMGVSLEDGLKKARLAAEGNFKSFEKLIPSIKGMTTDEEKLAAVMELTNRGLQQKEERAQSAAGAGERLANQLGNLAETLGSALSPILAAVQDGIARVAEVLVSILAPSLESTGGLLQTWSEWATQSVNTVANAIISGLTMAEVVYNNFGAVVQMAFDSVMLSYETYRADTEHLFVTTIPAYVTWFAESFHTLMSAAFDGVVNLVQKQIATIMDTMSVLWDFIASGGSSDVLGRLGEIAGRSYLEGFEVSIRDLPNVAARALTGKEQELQAAINGTSESLAAQFMTKFNERAIKLGEKVGGDLSGAIDLQLKQKGVDSISAKLAGAGGLSSNNPLVSGQGELSAVESRLLTRGPVRRLDPMALTNKKLDDILLTNKGSMSSLKNIESSLGGDGIKVVDAA